MCTSASTTSSCYDSSSSYVWSTWASDSTSGTSTGSLSSSNGYIWTSWVGDAVTYSATTTSNSTYTMVWSDWVEDADQETVQYAPPVEQSNSDDQWKKRQEERKAAEAKAVELLEVLIGKEQTKVYMETGRVFLKGKKFDYHIVKGSGFNIRKIEKDKVRDLCVHINKYEFPDTVNVVALLLALQEDEEAVLEMANDQGASKDMPMENFPRAAIAGG